MSLSARSRFRVFLFRITYLFWLADIGYVKSETFILLWILRPFILSRFLAYTDYVVFIIGVEVIRESGYLELAKDFGFFRI